MSRKKSLDVEVTLVAAIKCRVSAQIVPLVVSLMRDQSLLTDRFFVNNIRLALRERQRHVMGFGSY